LRAGFVEVGVRPIYEAAPRRGLVNRLLGLWREPPRLLLAPRRAKAIGCGSAARARRPDKESPQRSNEQGSDKAADGASWIDRFQQNPGLQVKAISLNTLAGSSQVHRPTITPEEREKSPLRN